MTTIPKLITAAEYAKLLDAASTDRDRIILKLLAGCGFRVGELVGLRAEDIDLHEGIIHLQAFRTKTKQYRDVIIPPSILEDLKAYLAKVQPGAYLFPGRKEGSHLTIIRVRQMIHNLADLAGIQRVYGKDKNGRPLYIVSPHTLRHYHAVASLDHLVPLNDISAQLGHSDLRTTSVYLRADLNHRKQSYANAAF